MDVFPTVPVCEPGRTHNVSKPYRRSPPINPLALNARCTRTTPRRQDRPWVWACTRMPRGLTARSARGNSGRTPACGKPEQQRPISGSWLEILLSVMRWCGLVLGDAVPRAQVAAACDAGRTGAIRRRERLRLARLETHGHLVSNHRPKLTCRSQSIWDGDGAISLSKRTTPHGRMGFRMAKAGTLKTAQKGHVVLVARVLHNPTGAKPKRMRWDAVIKGSAKTPVPTT